MRHFAFCFLFLLGAVSGFSQKHFSPNFHPTPPFPARMGTQTVAAWGSAADCRPDSLLHYEYDGNDSFLLTKTIPHYYGNNVARYYYYALNQPLILIRKDSVAYDSQGRKILFEWQTYDAILNGLRPAHRFQYYPRNTSTFDSVIHSSYNSNTQTLTLDTKSVYHYNSNEQVIGLDQYTWNDSIGLWQPYSRYLVTFTPTGHIDFVSLESWVNSAYQPLEYTQYSYDSNDSLFSILATNAITDVPIHKGEFFYDEAAKSTLLHFYQWNVDLQQWVFEEHNLNDYDLQGRLEAKEYVFYHLPIFGRRSEYYYIDNSECLWLEVGYTTEDGATWQLDTKTYYYSNNIVAAQEPQQELAWLAYPNPAHDGFWLEAPVDSPVQILDLQGKILYSGLAAGKEFIALYDVRGTVVVRVGTTARLWKVGW